MYTFKKKFVSKIRTKLSGKSFQVYRYTYADSASAKDDDKELFTKMHCIIVFFNRIPITSSKICSYNALCVGKKDRLSRVTIICGAIIPSLKALGKVAAGLSYLEQLKNILPKSQLCSVYRALVERHMLMSFGVTYPGLKHKPYNVSMIEISL